MKLAYCARYGGQQVWPQGMKHAPAAEVDELYFALDYWVQREKSPTPKPTGR